MLVSELIELTALLAVNGSGFVLGNGMLSDDGIQRYWAASRNRYSRWQSTLRRVPAITTETRQTGDRLPQWAATAEEIFASEVLTRIWTSIASEYDRRRGSNEIAPLVSSVFFRHLDARNWALNLLVERHSTETQQVARLNRVRRRSEQWVDMLLAHLYPACDIDGLAFDFRRMLDFAENYCEAPPSGTESSLWESTVVSMKAAFRSQAATPSVNEDLNREIMSGILACFEPETIYAAGQLPSLWMDVMDNAASSTQQMIDELLAIDARCDSC